MLRKSVIMLYLLAVLPLVAHAIEDEMFSLSLAELMNIKVATLTESDERHTPAAVTVIT